MTSFSPLMTEMTGVWYGASTGMPPVPLVQRSSPVFLSKQKTRYWLLALSPQPNATPATKSWSSSMAGGGGGPPSGGAPAEGGDQAEVRGHLPLPDFLAGLGIKAIELGLGTQGVHAVGFGVADYVGPADPVERQVGL